MRYVLLDVETNTLSTMGRVIVQLAYIILDNKQIKKTYSEYFYLKDTDYMEPDALALHGLYKEKLSGLANRYFEDSIQELSETLRTCDVIVAHNASFDIGSLRLYGNTNLNNILDNLKVIDTCKDFSKYIGIPIYGKNGYSIKFPSINECTSMLINSGEKYETIVSSFNCYFPNNCFGFHNAAFDVFIVYRLMMKLGEVISV